MVFVFDLIPVSDHTGVKASAEKNTRFGFVRYFGVLFAGSSILPFVKKLFSLDELFTLPDGGIYLFYYLCGYLFAKYPGKENKREGAGKGASRKTRELVFWGAVFACVLLAAGMAASRIVWDDTVQMAYNYPFTVLLSLLLMWIFREREGKEKENTGLAGKSAGALCFGVYLIHPVFVNLYYKFLGLTPLNFPKEALVFGWIPRIFCRCRFSFWRSWFRHFWEPLCFGKSGSAKVRALNMRFEENKSFLEITFPPP